MKIPNNINLGWEITASELSERRIKIIKRNAVIFLIAAAIAFLSKKDSYDYFKELIQNRSNFLYFLASIITLISIFSIFYFWQKKEIAYALDKTGILIRKGKSSSFYNWNEFDHFALKFYQDEKKSNSDIIGETFYLKIKPISLSSIIFNKTLMLQSEPDNQDKIYAVLKEILPEENIIKSPSFSISRRISL